MPNKPSTIVGDWVFAGAVTFAGGFAAPVESIGNAAIVTGAAIDAAKLDHQYNLTYGQTGNAASATIPIHFSYAAGVVLQVQAGSIGVAVGAATVTIDLKKGGVTMLTAVITLDSANAARVPELATISGAGTYADDQLLELVIVATAGGGTLPTGLFVNVVTREASGG